MKTYSVGELKANFSEILKDVEKGEKVAIAFGKKKEVKAIIVPKENEKLPPRKLGFLKGEKYFMAKDFNKTTKAEFDI